MKFLDVRNPVAASADGKIIECEVEFAGIGWLPFAASADDVEAHGRAIHAAITAGEYGAVGAYVEPVIPVEELRSRAYNARGATVGAMTVALWERVVEGRTESSDALQAVRVQVKAEFPK